MSVAAPAHEGPPFMMDFGTTVVAGGKMELAIRDQRPLRRSLAPRNHVRPSADPRDFWAGGSIPPLGGDAETGGYKGYALAVMVDVFSGVLSGTGYGSMLTLQTQGVFLGAWQVEAFLPLEDFTGMIDKALGTLRETPPAAGHDRALTPGQREWTTQEERSRLGIPLHPTVIAELRRVGMRARYPRFRPRSRSPCDARRTVMRKALTSRRQFLKTAAATAGLLTGPPFVSTPGRPANSRSR